METLFTDSEERLQTLVHLFSAAKAGSQSTPLPSASKSGVAGALRVKHVVITDPALFSPEWRQNFDKVGVKLHLLQELEASFLLMFGIHC